MFVLTIETDSAAFEDDPTAEVACILHALAYRMTGASPDKNYPLRGSNGNKVGEAEFL